MLIKNSNFFLYYSNWNFQNSEIFLFTFEVRIYFEIKTNEILVTIFHLFKHATNQLKIN